MSSHRPRLEDGPAHEISPTQMDKLGDAGPDQPPVRKLKRRDRKMEIDLNALLIVIR